MKNNFEPRQVRDFGEIINDTFVFAYQFWKPLLRAFVNICGIFVVGGMISSILSQFRMIKGIRNPSGHSVSSIVGNMLGFEYILSILMVLLTYTTITLTVMAFIHLYREKGKEAPSVEEVWEYVKYYFFRFLLASIVLVILSMIGLFFLVIPGIYLWVVFSLIYPIMIIENTPFGSAFGKAFKLIKGNWWITFAVTFIMFLVIVGASLLISLPMSIAGFGSSALALKNASAMTVVGGVVLNHLGYVFMVLPNIAIALCYYSLSEQKEGLGLLERIQTMNTAEVKPIQDQEEY